MFASLKVLNLKVRVWETCMYVDSLAGSMVKNLSVNAGDAED